MPSNWGLTRAAEKVRQRDVAVVAVGVFLIIWFFLDVGRRARIVPGKPEVHKTDFSVYTEAGAAFFDGREPYDVKNVRGWSYIYPPLFALMVAPLSVLDSVSQAFVWYLVSVACGFGCVIESIRLWRFLATRAPDGPPADALWLWVVVAAGLTVFLPTMECLQRGQVGVALLYAILLGLRLVVSEKEWKRVFLGSLVLAWPAVVKLIPALPVAFLVWQRWVVAVSPGRSRHELNRASVLSLGITVGVVLFLFVIPGATLGWNKNLGYLHTWMDKVVINEDPGQSYKAHLDSTNNQSLSNAAHLLAASMRVEQPGDPAIFMVQWAKTPEQRRWARDTAVAMMRRADRKTELVVQIARSVILALIMGLPFAVRRDDLTGHTAAFGLACVGMLLVSPIAWTHYYMMMLPAVIGLPLWLSQRGHPVTARWMAVVPVVLISSHYLAKPWVGEFGLLGLGTTAYFVTSILLAIRIGRFERRPGRSAWSHGPTVNSALPSSRTTATPIFSVEVARSAPAGAGRLP
jgi:hypothetical protein